MFCLDIGAKKLDNLSTVTVPSKKERLHLYNNQFRLSKYIEKTCINPTISYITAPFNFSGAAKDLLGTRNIFFYFSLLQFYQNLCDSTTGRESKGFLNQITVSQNLSHPPPPPPLFVKKKMIHIKDSCSTVLQKIRVNWHCVKNDRHCLCCLGGLCNPRTKTCTRGKEQASPREGDSGRLGWWWWWW